MAAASQQVHVGSSSLLSTSRRKEYREVDLEVEFSPKASNATDGKSGVAGKGKEVVVGAVAAKSHGRTAVIEVVSSPAEKADVRQDVERLPLSTIGLCSMVAAGVQFGWALQLSLLTPYMQTLGVEHKWASFVWLCGPISGILVQPVVGAWSDNLQSRFGRRRPFIVAGSFFVTLAILVIGFSTDIGYLLGDGLDVDAASDLAARDRSGATRGSNRHKKWARIVFIMGFWLLDLANNTIQGPMRALLADLAGVDQLEAAQAFYSLWTSLGSILGYAAGSSGLWYQWFPFLSTRACSEICANLKAAFIIAVVFLLFSMVVTIFSASEKQFVPPHLPRDEEAETASLLPKPTKAHVEAGPRRHTHTSPRARVMKSEKPKTVLPKRSDSGAKGRGDWDFEMVDLGSEFSPRGFSEAAERESGKESREDKLVSGIRGKVDGFFSNLLGGLRNLTTPMRMVLLVTALSWVAWFPFLLYSTDFMGREIYGGEPKTKDHDKYLKYEEGVEKGALGLLLNSVVGAGTALMIDPLCRLLGSERIWALSNFIQFACMTAMARLSMLAQTVASANDNHTLGNWSHYASTLIFAILGAPFAITLSIPYALMGEFTAEEGGGQGLSMGILNLAIVLPQVVVSIVSGPLDERFGGGNTAGFLAAAVFAFSAGTVALASLPKSSAADKKKERPKFFGHGMH